MEILSRNQGSVSGGLLHHVRTKVPKCGSGGAELEWFLLSSDSFNSSSVLIRPDCLICADGGPVSAKMPIKRRQAILDARSGPRGGGQAAQPWSIISSDWFSILHWLFPATSSLH